MILFNNILIVIKLLRNLLSEVNMSQGSSKNDVKLQDIVSTKKPDDVFLEVKNIISMIFDEFDYGLFETMYNDVIKLYNGQYPGYKKCNTDYHDLTHTLDVLLASLLDCPSQLPDPRTEVLEILPRDRAAGVAAIVDVSVFPGHLQEQARFGAESSLTFVGLGVSWG